MESASPAAVLLSSNADGKEIAGRLAARIGSGVLTDVVEVKEGGKAVHLKDDGLHGSDVVQTGWALARALGTIEGTELVIAGNEATDGTGGAVPAVIAEYLGLPQLTHVGKLSIEGTLVEIGVESDEVGLENAGSTVLSSTPKPPKTAGEKVTDEGEGGNDVAKYLVAQKII